jgi:hypothetical protein
MAPRSAARPAKKPARAETLSRVGKTPVKKTAPKKTVAKKTAAKKTVKKVAARKSVGSRTTKRLLKEKRDAAVLARKKTQDATLLRVDETDVVIDEHDEVAQQKLARLRRTAADKAGDPPPAAGVALVERVTRAVERELLQIETIVGGHHVKPQQRSEAERRARTLASLARTLTEVRRLRAADEMRRPPDGPSAARDLDAFRRILWTRLEGMVGRPAAVPAGDDESGGDR